MPQDDSDKQLLKLSPVYIVSGGNGASGELVARTLLAQFSNVNVPIVVDPYVCTPAQVQAVVEQAENTGGTLIHTMVDGALRQQLNKMVQDKHVNAFDLFGPLLIHFSKMLGQEPAGKPGLYRQFNQAYFKLIEAIDYTVAHDDGKRAYELSLADIILLGVSRVGKTPLSIYLSMQGWKVANIPLAPKVQTPAELFTVNPRKVIGLTIAPAQLLQHRRWRQQSLGIPSGSYSEIEAVREELREANHFFATHDFAAIDVTDKPIETSGEEVVMKITQG